MCPNWRMGVEPRSFLATRAFHLRPIFLLAIRLSASRTFLSEPATSHESNNNYFSHKINQHQPPAN
jgi:hypothetical protein